MKISLLTPNVSSNCLGRAWLLAKVLQRKYEVEVLGPDFGQGIWKALAGDNSVQINAIKISKGPKAYYQILNMLKKIDGDVIYASKPLFTSFGLALMKKAGSNVPLVVDIDDWELGFLYEKRKNMSRISYLGELALKTIYLYYPELYWTVILLEQLTRFSDEITVSNHFLKKRFGGRLIYHGRDTDYFNPSNFQKEEIRKKLDIGDQTTVLLFSGTLRKHKGIENLIKAVETVENENLNLFVVGLDNSDYSNRLKQYAIDKLGQRFRWWGIQPFHKVPEFIAACDVFVIPQEKNFGTLGQIPAKLFDAMAMAKPIIASNVSDMPLVLKNCGWIVDPNNVQHLVDTIQVILSDPEVATEMGLKARQKCVKYYSWNSMVKPLTKIFEKYE